MSEREAADNCLEGLACPKCKQFEHLRIDVKITVDVYDAGTEPGGDTEWEDESWCQCVECGHTATVADFSLENQKSTSGKWRFHVARHASCSTHVEVYGADFAEAGEAALEKARDMDFADGSEYLSELEILGGEAL